MAAAEVAQYGDSNKSRPPTKFQFILLPALVWSLSRLDFIRAPPPPLAPLPLCRLHLTHDETKDELSRSPPWCARQSVAIDKDETGRIGATLALELIEILICSA